MATSNRDSEIKFVEPEQIPLNADFIQAQTKPEVQRNLKEKVKYFCQNITVEPTVMLFFVGYMVTSTTTTNLSLEKACRVNLNFTDEICTGIMDQTLENQNPYEQEVQKLVSSVVTWKTYVSASIPSVIALFVGPWQDRTGHRKVFLVIPLVGLLLSAVNSILHVRFFYEMNLEALMFSGAVIEALSGSLCIMMITAFSFIAAITNTENRTFRMGLVNFSLTVGIPIGTASSGIMVKTLGYYGSFGIGMGIHLINMLYTTFVLKDPKRNSEHKKVS